MKKKIYLAVVKKDFKLNDSIRDYFKSKDIEIINYLKNIGILKLSSKKPLNANEIKHVEFLELDKEINLIDENDDT
ncbi:hypothetical protein [Urechidicola croceus]|uniref:Uncharacterized protein n=1 Tax=Urechidicola croceus TaxID=1850246 RepID=A0A1D8P3L5_9FLAO|nr:hypothetical protein [Urechidicola croceus]AOW19178.1 hypothetical protein LPB138_00070 [Urechidicola croceus]